MQMNSNSPYQTFDSSSDIGSGRAMYDFPMPHLCSVYL